MPRTPRSSFKALALILGLVLLCLFGAAAWDLAEADTLVELDLGRFEFEDLGLEGISLDDLGLAELGFDGEATGAPADRDRRAGARYALASRTETTGTFEAPASPGCSVELAAIPPVSVSGPDPEPLHLLTVRMDERELPEEHAIPHAVFSLFTRPGESVTLGMVDRLPEDGSAPAASAPDEGPSVLGIADSGLLTCASEDRAEWTWTAPTEPGLYPLRFADAESGDVFTLHAFVLTPYEGEERLNGYRFGEYPTVPLRGNLVYLRPSGFVEVDRSLLEVPVSPNFELGQFLCKQEAGWPRYLALDERLLLKLELLLDEVHDQGIDASTFHVMSGYRTPHYNRAIGNTTTYSRHLYGDAADIFIDEDGDGRMDDLDGDGRETVADAEVLYQLVESSFHQDWYSPFIGGMGLYGPKSYRGPFVHVDTRGFRARW